MTTPLDPTDLNYMHFAGKSSEDVQRDVDARLQAVYLKQDELRQMRAEFATNADPDLKDEITRLNDDIRKRQEIIDAGERLLSVWPAPSTSAPTTSTPSVSPGGPVPVAPASGGPGPVAPASGGPGPVATASSGNNMKRAGRWVIGIGMPLANFSKSFRDWGKDPAAIAAPAAAAGGKQNYWTTKRVVGTGAALTALVYVGSVVKHHFTSDKSQRDAPQDQSVDGTGSGVTVPECGLTDEVAIDEADKSLEAVGADDAIGAIQVAQADLLDEFGSQCTSDEIVHGQGVAAARINEATGGTRDSNVPTTEASAPTTEQERVPNGTVACITDENGDRVISYTNGVPDVNDIPHDLWEDSSCDVAPGQNVVVDIGGGEAIGIEGR